MSTHRVQCMFLWRNKKKAKKKNIGSIITLIIQTDRPEQRVNPDQMLQNAHLIRVYTVCLMQQFIVRSAGMKMHVQFVQ